MADRFQRSTALTLLLLALPLGANESQEKLPYPERLVEDFGRVLYCQQAYDAPQNARRVYGHDREQCAAARRVIDGELANYPLGAQAQLQDHAKRRAAVIRGNTQDVYQVLGACREACATIANRAESGTEPNTEDNDS